MYTSFFGKAKDDSNVLQCNYFGEMKYSVRNFCISIWTSVSALSWRMIERIFSGAVTRGRLQKQDRMGYQEFVWFLISEEDKRHPTAIEYWFR